MLPQGLKHFDVFVDGFGHVGTVEEGNPPKISKVMEEHNAGGMAGTRDIDMYKLEKMTNEITIKGINENLRKAFGNDDLSIIFRGSTTGPNGTQSVVITTRGQIAEQELDGFKAETANGMTKATCSYHYYKEEIGGVEVLEIDVDNMIYKVDGVDRLAEHRANIGSN